jgi:hypothetical protein
MCYFMCVVSTFQSFVVKGARWLDMELDHVHNYASCHLPHVDGQIDLSLAIFPIGFCCTCCVGKPQGLAPC